MDPGNWATDLAAGSAYGYDLLAAILLANICAIFFQVRHPPCATTVCGIAMPALACACNSMQHLDACLDIYCYLIHMPSALLTQLSAAAQHCKHPALAAALIPPAPPVKGISLYSC